MAWLALLLAAAFEIGFTTSLRFVDQFRNLPAVAAFVVCITASLGLVEFAARTIPLGTAYAIWTGIGAAGTVAIGMIWFGEPVSAARIGLIAAIIVAAALLKLTG